MNHAKTLCSIRLTVNNHPGVMSHVCGLFTRRAFNMEGILVTPCKNGQEADVWLMVHADDRLEQMVRQLKKLHDAKSISVRPVDAETFDRLDACMESLELEIA